MDSTINSLSYHIAFAVLELIKKADADIYHRLNITVLIKECAKAMGASKGISEIEEDIEILRDAYEPEMDISPYTYTKRAIFEKQLDSLQERLLKIINDENLISQSVMQEIIVGKFGNDEKGKGKRMDKKVHL